MAQTEAAIGTGEDRGVGTQDRTTRSARLEFGEVLLAEKNR